MEINEEMENNRLFSITITENNKKCQIDCFDDSKEYKYKNCLYTNNFELDDLDSFLEVIKKYSKDYKGIVFELDFFNKRAIDKIKKMKKLEENIYFYEF